MQQAPSINQIQRRRACPTYTQPRFARIPALDQRRTRYSKSTLHNAYRITSRPPLALPLHTEQTKAKDASILRLQHLASPLQRSQPYQEVVQASKEHVCKI